MWQRNRWIILGAPVLTLLAALLFIKLSVPIYDAWAVMRLDKERSNLAVLDALQELSTGSEIHTEMRDMRSRTLAEDVVDGLDLHAELREPDRVTRSTIFSGLSVSRTADKADYKLERVSERAFRVSGGGRSQEVSVGQPVRFPGVEFTLAPAAAQYPELELRVREFPIAVRAFMRTLDVSRPDREANIVEVRYEGRDPELVRAVPNEVARRFILRRDSVRKTQARSTVFFLAQQIDTLGRRLRAAEGGLLAFRESQRVVSPQVEGETQVSRLANLQADRELAEAERSSLAGMMAEIERTPAEQSDAPYKRLIGFPMVLKNPAVSELLRSLNELQSRRTELLRTSREADPEVVLLTQSIRARDLELKQLMSTYLTALTDQVRSYDALLSRFQNEVLRIPAKEIQLARLRREATSMEDIYTALLERMHETQIAAAVEDPSVRILDPAIMPLKPIRPNQPLSLLLALILGLALGGGFAFVREHVDNTIRNRDELQEASGAIPVLGMVPRIVLPADRKAKRGVFAFAGNGGAHPDFTRVTVDHDARGPVAEAYRTLRTNIAFTRQDVPLKVLVISSALPGEGKSTSASNLAIALAQQGQKVALIDADMRRGTLHNSLGAASEPGLSNVLAGQLAPTDALQPIRLEGVSLYFMPTGTLPPNPAELLASTRVSQLLDELRPEFDVIVIDTPPLNVVTDAAIIGARADGVLLVARAAVTDRDAYRYAIEQVHAVRARVLGCVLNDVEAHTGGYYGRAKEYYAPRPAS